MEPSSVSAQPGPVKDKPFLPKLANDVDGGGVGPHGYRLREASTSVGEVSIISPQKYATPASTGPQTGRLHICKTWYVIRFSVDLSTV